MYALLPIFKNLWKTDSKHFLADLFLICYTLRFFIMLPEARQFLIESLKYQVQVRSSFFSVCSSPSFWFLKARKETAMLWGHEKRCIFHDFWAVEIYSSCWPAETFPSSSIPTAVPCLPLGRSFCSLTLYLMNQYVLCRCCSVLHHVLATCRICNHAYYLQSRHLSPNPISSAFS